MMQVNARIGLGRGAPIRRPRSIVISNPVNQRERPFPRSQQRTYSNDGKPKSRALPDLKNFLKAASEPKEQTVSGEDLDGHEGQDGSRSLSSFDHMKPTAPLGMGRGSLLKQSNLFSEDIQRRKEELETRRRTDMEEIDFGEVEEGEEEEGDPGLDVDEISQQIAEVASDPDVDLEDLKSSEYYDENPLFDEDPGEVQETFLEDIEEAEDIEGKAYDDYEGLIFGKDPSDLMGDHHEDDFEEDLGYNAEYGTEYGTGYNADYDNEMEDDDVEDNVDGYVEGGLEYNFDDDLFGEDEVNYDDVELDEEDVAAYESLGIEYYDAEGRSIGPEDVAEGDAILEKEGIHLDEKGNLVDKEGNDIDQDTLHRLLEEESALVDEEGNIIDDKYYTTPEVELKLEAKEGNDLFTQQEQELEEGEGEEEYFLDDDEIYDEEGNVYLGEEENDLEEDENEYLFGEEDENEYLGEEGENEYLGEEDENEYLLGEEDENEYLLGEEDENPGIDEEGNELDDEEEEGSKLFRGKNLEEYMKEQLDKLIEETEEQEIARETREKIEIGEMLKDTDAYGDLLLTPTFYLRNQTVVDNDIDTMKVGEPLEDLEGGEQKVEMGNILDVIESLKDDTTAALAEIGKDFDTDHAFQQVKVAEFKEKMKRVWKIRAKKAKERRAKREPKPNVIPPQHLEGFGIHFPELFQQIPQDHKYLPELERAARVLSKNGVYTHQEKYKMMQTIITATMEEPVPDDFIPGQTLDRVAVPKPIIEEESYYFQDEEDEFLRPPERTY